MGSLAGIAIVRSQSAPPTREGSGADFFIGARGSHSGSHPLCARGLRTYLQNLQAQAGAEWVRSTHLVRTPTCAMAPNPFSMKNRLTIFNFWILPVWKKFSRPFVIFRHSYSVFQCTNGCLIKTSIPLSLYFSSLASFFWAAIWPKITRLREKFRNIVIVGQMCAFAPTLMTLRWMSLTQTAKFE